jgi:hypothetical protein
VGTRLASIYGGVVGDQLGWCCRQLHYLAKPMTKSSSHHLVRRGRVFPEKQLSPEEKAIIEAEDKVNLIVEESYFLKLV